MEYNQDPNFIPSSDSRNSSGEKNTVVAFLSYIFFIIPIFTDAKSDPFVIFHAKQSFVILIITLCLRLFYIVTGWYIPFVILSTVLFILWCMGVMSVFMEKQTSLPFIGVVARKIKL
jgi:uncharacterized membrane protein